MNESYIKNVVEAAMLAAGRPLPLAELAALFDEANRPSAAALRAALASLEEDYAGRGIELKETATGFRIQVRRDVANEVSRLWPERPAKYSRALLETLALIAYRQPITRAEIEAVRGVAVNPNIIKTLLERNWVRVVGNRDVPGRPELLGTTKDFLDYFGLRSLDELPPLAELKAMGDVNLQLDLAKDSAGEGTAAGAAGAAAAGAGVAEAGAAGANAAGAAAAEASAASDAGGESGGQAAETTAAAGAGEDSDVEDDASVDALLEATEAGGENVDAETLAAGDETNAVEDDDAGDRADAVEAASEDEPSDALEAGPQKRAAEAFVAELEADDDAESASGEEDSGEDDELSADSQSSGELVAGPRHLDD
jgi:segregation and condensation protein B